jgi:hypothetical protein
MALDSFKRVQALKAERNKLSAELDERATADVSRIHKSIGDDFVNFLAQEGFRVTRLKNAIGAIYGDARLSLEFPAANERFGKALTVLSLLDSRNPDNKWLLSIIPRDADGTPLPPPLPLMAQSGAVTLENMIEVLRRSNERFLPSDYFIRFQMVAVKDSQPASEEAQSARSIVDVLSAVLEEPLFNY